MKPLARIAGALLALGALVALFVVPGVLAWAQRDGAPPSDEVVAAAFTSIQRAVPALELSRRQADVTLQLEGGLIQVGTCRRVESGGEGWICVTLNSTGDRPAAAWTADRPEAPPKELFFTDDDPDTVPNR